MSNALPAVLDPADSPSPAAPFGTPSPRPQRARPWVLLPAAGAIVAWVGFLADRSPGTAAALFGFPLDDAWIHMVYARSLATAGGFHYNTGVPETGMTSPLWVLLLAPMHALVSGLGVGAIAVGAKLLSLLCGVAGVFALHKLARALGLGEVAAILAASLFALDPSLTFSRAAGMEVPLFTLLVLVAALQAVRGRAIGTGLAAGLAIVARPEGVLVLPALALGLLAGRGARVSLGRWMFAAALLVLPALAWAAFCLYATGVPLPNTYYAKFQPVAQPLLPSVVAAWREYVHGNLPWFTFESGSVLAVLGTIALLRRAPLGAVVVLSSGALLFVGTVASRELAPGHYHYWERWLLPAVPMLLLAIAAGADEIRKGFSSLSRRTAAAPARTYALLALAAAIALVAGLPRGFVERAHLFAWNCRNIDDLNVAMGRWVDAHLPQGAVIAVNDAGALRYFGNRTTIDLLGLNDHRVRTALKSGRSDEYLVERGVEWFVVFPTWFSEIIDRLGLEPIHAVQAERYTICGAPLDVVAVYRWPRR